MKAPGSAPGDKHLANGRFPTGLLVLLVCSALAALVAVNLLESHVEAHRLGRPGANETWWHSSLFMGVLASMLGGLLLASATWMSRYALRMLRMAQLPAPDPNRARRARSLGPRHGSRRAIGLLVVAGFLVLGGVILPWSLLRVALGI